MAILKWSTPPAEHEGRELDIARGDNVGLAVARGGTPLAAVEQNSFGDNIGPATVFTGAPHDDYRKPVKPKPETEERPGSRLGRCYANDDTCRGWATITGFCAGHSRSMGLPQ